MYHKNKSLCFLVAEVAEVAERGRKRAFLTLSEGQVGRDGLAVVEGALAQHLVVSDFLVHLTEDDVSVTPKRNDKIKHFYNMFIEISQR